MTARPRAVIIGMMGAGKTRVGKEVAHMLRLPFADADVEIEREVGMKIPSYFEEYGEPAFREVEADLIADMLEDFDGIFSLGGGAPMTPSTQHALASYIDHGGRVVYLDADPAEAMEHIDRFYRIFHSYRFVGDSIVIRLNAQLPAQWVEHLERDFSDLILPGGKMIQSGPLPDEADEPHLDRLPRLVFPIKRGNYGRLSLLIDRINQTPSRTYSPPTHA